MTVRKRPSSADIARQPPPSLEVIPNFLHELAELIQEKDPQNAFVQKQHLWLDVTPANDPHFKNKKVFATLIRKTECLEFRDAFNKHNILVNNCKIAGQSDPNHPLYQYALHAGFPQRLMSYGEKANSAGWEAKNINTILPDGYTLEGRNPLAAKLGGTQIHFIIPEDVDDSKPAWRRIELVVPADKAEEVVPLGRRIPEDTMSNLLKNYSPAPKREGIIPPENPKKLRFNAENLVMMAHNATFVGIGQGTFSLKVPSTMLPALKQHLKKLGITDCLATQDGMPEMVATRGIFQEAFGELPALARATSHIITQGAEIKSPPRGHSSGRMRGGEQNTRYWWQEPND